MELDSSLLLLMILVFIAGFIDSIVGGGGIITIPAYLNYGISEDILLGTNKLSSTMGTLSAVLRYFREIRFSSKILITVFLFSIISSFSGAYLVSLLPPNIIRIMIVSILPFVLVYLIRSKDFGVRDYSSNLDEKKKYVRLCLITTIVSFYDGLMGPGTGTFLAIGYSKYIGYDILTSTVLAKFTNLISNLSALFTFLSVGKLNMKIGFFMGLISILGNLVGVRLALKKGIWIIRPFMILISTLIILKLLIDTFKI